VEDYLAQLYQKFLAKLPPTVIKTIRTFREDPNNSVALLLRNFPVDANLPPTPSDGKRNLEKTAYVTEGCLLGISLLLGEVHGMAQVKQGELVQNICPVSEKSNSQSNEGYGSELKMHTEMSFHPTLRPNYFILSCLREDVKKESLTYLTDNRKVLASLDEKDQVNLRDPRFKIHGPESFKSMWTPVEKPIVLGPKEFPEIVLGMHSDIDSPSEEARLSLEKLKLSIEKLKSGVHLQPGELLVVDNRRGMHGRNQYTTEFAGKDRWLQRVHIKETSPWKEHLDVKFPTRVFDGCKI